MKLLRRIYILAKNNCRLVWPYDLSLLRTLGVFFLVGALLWQLNLSVLNPTERHGARSSVLYLTLFSEQNAMVEFEHELGDYYAFPKVQNAFGDIKISQVQRFTKGEFEALVLSTLPQELRAKLSNYLSFAVETAQKYQVDPFWVLAVMWTESHFEHMSESSQKAVGFMQIVPQTGHFITQKVLKKGITYKDVKSYIKEPYVNIELGTIYLKRLLDRFHNNYRLATVAYNLGPNRVLERLNGGEKVGNQNVYLDKVAASYKKLTKYYRIALKEQDSPFENSYVFRERSLRTGAFFATLLPMDLKKAFVNKTSSRALTHIPSWQLISLVD